MSSEEIKYVVRMELPDADVARKGYLFEKQIAPLPIPPFVGLRIDVDNTGQSDVVERVVWLPHANVIRMYLRDFRKPYDWPPDLSEKELARFAQHGWVDLRKPNQMTTHQR